MKSLSRFLALLAAAALMVTAFSACKKTGSDTSGPAEASSLTSTTPPTDAEGLTDADRAWALYEAATKKADSASGFDATLTGTASVTAGQQTTEYSFDVSWISQQKASTSDGFADHLTETIVKGSDVTERDAYYGGGTLYVAQNKQRFRQRIDRKSAVAEIALFSRPSMTKAAFASPLIVYEQGVTTLSLLVNGDVLSETLTSSDGALSYLLGGIKENVDYAFGDITVTITIDENGFLSSLSTYYTVIANDEDVTTATVSLSIVYDRLGEQISVKLPNAANYKERIGSGLSKDAYAVMTDVVDLLYGADGERVEDFDDAYKDACKKYKKNLVDEIVEWFEEQ